MKINQIKRLLLLSLVLTAPLTPFLGCSGIGYAIGEAIDNSQPDTVTLRMEQLGALESGRKLEVIRHDDRRDIGEFVGLHPTPQDNYCATYDSMRHALQGLSLPAIGDYLDLSWFSGNKSMRVRFQGFDYNAIIFTSEDKSTRASLDSLWRILDSRGKLIEIKGIQLAINSSQVPIVSQITISKDDKILHISSLDVKRIETGNPKRAKYIGAAIGLPIDAYVAYLLYNAAIKASMGLGLGSTSISLPISGPW
jgi:hypothetical protein